MLDQLLASTLAGESRALVLYGEAGVGKTELTKALDGKYVLGLVARVSDKLSARPEGAAIGCRVKL